eukprot:TRINITY_DN14824_c0_g1::TRINITY_DN14824_c0_g1_i1::g.30168::m.30168 TRINITY_DN14824_c0_g1::TRINITY_DN14824_c0_g1_i1::g.30168  ORF type:complete len:493 (-),score=108.82,sp/Q9ER88/RT29_MOUSE/25.00/5e-18,DAP3/PF10236.4/3.1e-41,Glyco_transf_64/PF09258.5/0.11 TRINITY_DN14824_c0_g1_i1:9-1439(-)
MASLVGRYIRRSPSLCSLRSFATPRTPVTPTPIPSAVKHLQLNVQTGAPTEVEGNSALNALLYQNTDIMVGDKAMYDPYTLVEQKKELALRMVELMQQEVNEDPALPSPEGEAGKTFFITKEDFNKYIPEGVTYGLDKEIGFLDHREFLIREPALKIIDMLKKSADQNALGNPMNPDHRYILTGEKGCGKSVSLLHSVYFARRSGWLVLFVPSVRKWTYHTYNVMPHQNCNPDDLGNLVFDSMENCTDIIKNMMAAHSDKLKTIKLKLKHKITEGENIRHLADLCELGLNRDPIGVAFALLNELNAVTEYPVLIAMDDYDGLWGWTRIADPRKHRYVRLYSTDLTLVRHFLQWSPKHLRNGRMIHAISWGYPTNKRYMPEVPEKMSVPVPRCDKDELRRICRIYQRNKMVLEPVTTDFVEKVYSLTRGRMDQVHTFLRDTVPTHLREGLYGDHATDLHHKQKRKQLLELSLKTATM